MNKIRKSDNYLGSRHGRWGMEHIFQASEYKKLNSENFLLKEFFDSCACFVRARVFDFAHA